MKESGREGRGTLPTEKSGERGKKRGVDKLAGMGESSYQKES